MIDDIVKIEEGVMVARRRDMSDGTNWIERRSGARLYMRDGTVWFHPYSGGAPVCEGRHNITA